MARIFISYSHKDAKSLAYVETHLAPLRRYHDIETWSDERLSLGDDWARALKQEMDAASATILLISAPFLASDFIQSVEVPRLLQRRRKDGLLVWPLILSPCGWKQVGWLAKLQHWPSAAQALSVLSKPKRDSAMADFAAQIHGALTPVIGSSETSVISELVIDKDLAKFTDAERDDFLDLLNRSLGDQPVAVRRIKPGSTRLFVEMTEAQLAKLKMLLEEGFLAHRPVELRGRLGESERQGLELFQFRKRAVIRDEVVASLFGVSTKQLNQAVKRNQEKFDEDHAFFLTATEWKALKSQIVTAKTGRGGRRTPPQMFTEKGVVMSSTVLRSPRAVEAAKLLVDVFINARRQAKSTRSNSFADAAIVDGLRVFDVSDDAD